MGYFKINKKIKTLFIKYLFLSYSETNSYLYKIALF